MEAEIAQQNRNQASIRQETYHLKKSANELKDQIANMSIALRELQAEERRLSKDVVDSPDRIKLELSNASRELEGVKRRIAEAQEEKAAVQERTGHAADAEERTRRVLELMNDLEGKLRRYESVMEEVQGVQDALEGAEREVEVRSGEKASRERQLEALGKLPSLPTRQMGHFALHAIVLTALTTSSLTRYEQKNERRTPCPC